MNRFEHKKSMLSVAVICLSLLNAFSLAQRNDEERDLVQNKSFNVGKGGTLEVILNGGDIRITTWEKSEVAVKVQGADQEELEDVSMSVSGKTIRIDNHPRGGWSGDLRFTISIPSEFNLDLRTTNGNLLLKGPLSGTVSGSTSAGDIETGSITGTVDLKTSGGDIHVSDIHGDLMLHTSGGDIRVGNVVGAAEVTTSGGNITLKNVHKTLLANTSGGDIAVGDVGGEATLTTSGGNIIVGRVSGSARLVTAGGDIDMGSASGVVKAKTAGGNINLDNIAGSVDAKTGGGDVSAELLPGGKGSSRIASGNGNIYLYVSDKVKATINASIRVQGGWRRSKDEYRIRSDFSAESYQPDDESREIRAVYKINGGGEVITLETSNADILIRHASDKTKMKEE